MSDPTVIARVPVVHVNEGQVLTVYLHGKTDDEPGDPVMIQVELKVKDGVPEVFLPGQHLSIAKPFKD